MRATKLLSVSVALWAVVAGADSASAGGVNVPIVTPSIKPPVLTPRVGTPSIKLTPNVRTSRTPIVQKVPGGAVGTGLTGKPTGAGSYTAPPWYNNYSNNPPSYNPLIGAGLPSGGRDPASAQATFTPPHNDPAGGGSGGARPARNYSPPTSYNNKTACGHYPYPACK
jgi:hypothetical protein